MSEDVLLSSDERTKLAECEQTIASRLGGQFEIGAALQQINAARLYRETHATFEDYVSRRWDILRGYAYQLMAAAAVRENLAEQFDTLPANEFQARPLTKLDAEDQQKVWGQVLKQAGPGGPTYYKVVKGAVDDLLEARKIAAAGQDDPAGFDGPADNQFRHGDPLKLIADLPRASCDLLLISDLPGGTPETAAANLLDFLDASLPTMKTNHQVFVITDLHDFRPLLDVAESLSYETGVPLIWVTDKERSVSDWCAKISSRYILHLRQGTAGLVAQIGNVISCDDEKFKLRPDQRPLALIRTLIEVATRPGETVLDPTAVAATANIGCRQIGRGCIGITNDKASYDAGVERLDESDGVENHEESN
jgi:hypothetical protein